MAQRNQCRNNPAGVCKKFHSTVSPRGSISGFSHQHVNAENRVKIESPQQAKRVRVLHQMIPVEFNHNSVHASIPVEGKENSTGKPRVKYPERDIKIVKDGDDDGGRDGDEDARLEAECTFYINKVKQRMMESVLNYGAAGSASSGRDKIRTTVLIASKENF